MLLDIAQLAIEIGGLCLRDGQNDIGNGAAICAMYDLLTGPQLLDQVEALTLAHRERLFPSIKTLSMFITQALSADGSCQQAVDDAIVERVLRGLESGKTDTGAYCKACIRLPLPMV